MTIGSERLRAINYAREFLEALLDPKITPRIGTEIRKSASRVLRHYPCELEMERIAKLAPDLLSDEFILGKSEHTTHFDDCGCKTTRLQKQVLDYQTRYEGALREIEVFQDEINDLKNELRTRRGTR